MIYQLVIQFKEAQISYDELLKLEETIGETISENDDVDGHDLGSGEANIFIHTDDPVACFNKIKNIMEDYYLGMAKITYRKLDENNYQILWPVDERIFEIK